MPKMAIAMALFTIIFLNLDDNGQNATTRHCSDPQRPKDLVKWKDVLSNEWKGPDPILLRSRGAVCVFPQDQESPFWLPERLTRTVKSDPQHTDSPEDLAAVPPAILWMDDRAPMEDTLSLPEAVTSQL